VNVVAQARSADLVPSKQGAPARLKLAIRCLEGKTTLAVHFGDHFMASSKYGNWGHVTYRIDRNAAVADGWVHSSDNEELSVEGPGAVRLALQLVSANSFLVRATPFGEGPLTITFDMQGFDAAIAPLRSSCRW